MMNKCAKFHKDSQIGEKGKFNLPSAIELSETADLLLFLLLLFTFHTNSQNYG